MLGSFQVLLIAKYVGCRRLTLIAQVLNVNQDTALGAKHTRILVIKSNTMPLCDLEISIACECHGLT